MKAIVIDRDFENSSVKEVDDPVVLTDQSMLNVKAVGICQSDISRVFDESAYYYPIILGHEFAGCTDNDIKATVFPIRPCHMCDECSKENYAQCEHYSYYGSRQDGGMQERLAVDNWNLITSSSLSYEELALIEPSAVAMNAVKTVPKDVESVLINGCGFIALVAAQILLHQHKTVYIRNRNREKIKFAINNFNVYEFNKQKFDCCIDFVSNSASMNFLINNVNPHGSIIAIGNPSKEVIFDKLSYSNILRKELAIHGIWNSKREDWLSVIDLISKHYIDVSRLITHKYSYLEFKKAFEKIRDNQINGNELIIKSIILF